ncbi:sugar ABC transporter permease [Mycoplasmopsis caviae]|uniref:Sugar ABC transporter permease n=1 Tax=Mycoplasmopsis caviae TaxID=55603 RepID=A0A3P8LB57_9BACT|nr:sugar ABC transporter permease [Mycoplasmopsis caviae]UUD34940.1 sugar ABC transporter permease [Mycoplasmopsis caviae]VDR42231.1 sn-glycerol-3-phosphate transport system permease protein ugpA [Mycoplasmopsis caviae]
MKSKNRFWIWLCRTFPFLLHFSLKKQAGRKSAISGSVIDKRKPFIVPFLLILPGIIVLALFTLVPFIFNLIYSFLTPNNSFTLQNFSDLFENREFAVGFRNSFIYGLLILPISMAVSLLVSSLIASIVRKRAQGFWQTIFFLPYVTNIVAVSLAFVQIFQKNGTFNTIFGLNIGWLDPQEKDPAYAMTSIFVMIVNGVWNGLAFNILLFTTAMLSVDKNLYRSASIDGVSNFKQFFTITLPSIMKTITFIVTMGIINGIKVFPLALFENNPAAAINSGASTLMLYIFQWASDSSKKAANISGAASVMLFVIGVCYSTIIRGGFSTLTLASLNLGESNVWNKIKNSNEIREFEAKKKARKGNSTSSRYIDL